MGDLFFPGVLRRGLMRCMPQIDPQICIPLYISERTFFVNNLQNTINTYDGKEYFFIPWEYHVLVSTLVTDIFV